MLTFDSCSSQIYTQKESQRAGYIELALQAYEQTEATSAGAWPTPSQTDMAPNYPHWGNQSIAVGINWKGFYVSLNVCISLEFGKSKLQDTWDGSWQLYIETLNKTCCITHMMIVKQFPNPGTNVLGTLS